MRVPAPSGGSWAKQRLTELLVGAEFDAPESSVEVVKIENLNGDAEVREARAPPPPTVRVHRVPASATTPWRNQ